MNNPPISNLNQEISRLHANICAAISDPRRLMLLYAIDQQPRNVSRLAESIGISQPAASRHLKLLQQRGLVRANREGASIIYTLTDPRLIEAMNLLRDVLYQRLEQRAELLDHEHRAEKET